MRGPEASKTLTLLLVEDDQRVRQALGLALSDLAYGVVEAASGEQALRLLSTGTRPDVVLLDVMLPGMDGLAVCAAIRSHGDVPIIMVTARSDTSDIIAGLEAGADDYVTKPLDAGELDARIRALLRRARPAEGGSPDELRAGELRVLVGENRVVRGETEIPLTKTEFRLLCELLAANGQVVSREQLLERVWGYDYFGDTRLLDVHIRRLRRKVEADPSRPRLVLTVRGTGYRVPS